jgi:putative phage-type endonuclease
MEQRTEQWHAARAGRITASTAGAFLGLSPFMKPEDAMRALVRSMHGMTPEFSGNVATEYGTFHEEGALVEYQMETGNTVTPLAFAPHRDWLGASPDGLVNRFGLIEIKCPFGQRKKNPPEFKSVKDQPQYYAQMQIQMYCTCRDWCDFFQWSPYGTKTERVWEDHKWLDINMPILRTAWEAARAADPADFEGPKRTAIDTPEAVRLVREYDELSDAMDAAKEKRDEVLANMVRIGGGKDATIAGRKLTLVKRAGSVAYAKALAAAAPKFDVEPYRGKGSGGWKFT